MQKKAATNRQNIVSRLFMRFFLCYALAVPVGLGIAARQWLSFNVLTFGNASLLFVALALLGAVLTLTKPYLLVLSVCKALYDVTVLFHISSLTQRGSLGILQWNICFLLVVSSLLLFALSAARAQLFSFLCPKRDTGLLFSREFGKYMIETVILLAIGSTLYFMWPQLMRQWEIFSSL